MVYNESSNSNNNNTIYDKVKGFHQTYLGLERLNTSFRCFNLPCSIVRTAFGADLQMDGRKHIGAKYLLHGYIDNLSHTRLSSHTCNALPTHNCLCWDYIQLLLLLLLSECAENTLNFGLLWIINGFVYYYNIIYQFAVIYSETIPAVDQ